ncbi:TrbI/VirB10 family protein [uncultured Ruegeria sp.]|uniref:TrbI/VirB10 family protein n=1 Tax=uncultured Ruegeria sp. TaxID=259304 RepID=UPI00260F5F0B|nr:TrbI/VirB10 family protein [uncultured Ruegeria sp.]
MTGSPNLKNFLATVGIIIAICGAILVGAQFAGIGLQTWLGTETAQTSGPEQRTNAQIDEQIAQMERNAGEFNNREATPATQEQPVQPSGPPQAPAAPVETPFAKELNEQALKEIRRREDRRQAALDSPIGESLFSIESIKASRQENSQPAAGSVNPYPESAGEIPASAEMQPGVDNYSLIRPGQVLLAAGTVIPGALIDEIRSEIEGEFRATVTNDVYGTLDPYKIVIPRGSMLLGKYDARSRIGQRRLKVEGIRALFPNGDALDLDGSVGIDADGASGLKGRRRTGFMSAVLGTGLVSLAENIGRKDTTNSDIADAARIASGAAVGTVADSYFRESLSLGPTFKVKAGRIFNIRLDHDVYLDEVPAQ